jgi:DNA-directed RNA polymerase specialized sigma24 family protein
MTSAGSGILVDSPPSLKKNWVLTGEAFEKLLLALDPDRERAAQRYERVRCRLITFFECRHCHSPEEQADVTMNRVARRLEEGGEIYADDPESFFLGVARNVVHEYWTEANKTSTPLDGLPPDKHHSPAPPEIIDREEERKCIERREECLEHCISELVPEKQTLIRRYYQGETSTKIRNRKLLAEELNIPVSALRIRALRIREALERCMLRCLQQLPVN